MSRHPVVGGGRGEWGVGGECGGSGGGGGGVVGVHLGQLQYHSACLYMHRDNEADKGTPAALPSLPKAAPVGDTLRPAPRACVVAQAERARLDQMVVADMHEMLHKLMAKASGDVLYSSSREKLMVRTGCESRRCELNGSSPCTSYPNSLSLSLSLSLLGLCAGSDCMQALTGHFSCALKGSLGPRH